MKPSKIVFYYEAEFVLPSSGDVHDRGFIYKYIYVYYTNIPCDCGQYTRLFSQGTEGKCSCILTTVTSNICYIIF